ncbi:hypothetical protein ECEC1847_2233, partial [Escherichia coli EC1847]
RAMRSRK